MMRNIPVKKLILTSALTSVIFTGLIAFLLYVNPGTVPDVARILLDTLLSIFFTGVLHIMVLKFIERNGAAWTRTKAEIFRYSITFILIFVYTLVIELLIGFFFEPEKFRHILTRTGFSEQLLGAGIISILIFFAHNQVLARQRRIDTELELSEIRAANIEATNLILQQQIQPHFLFNALNVLNGLYKRDYQTGHTYMLHLANFLRASISTSKQNVLTVADEIRICNDYVAMQKIRFNGALNFNIKVDPERLQQGFIPSFSLQPLIENAIKHNELTNENPVQIDLFNEDNHLYIRNNINPLIARATSTGQGLTNLKKRYELLSGDEVQIINDNKFFTVRIKILSDEYYHN